MATTNKAAPSSANQNEESGLERLLYYGKYTLATYGDVAMSLPIASASIVAKTSGYIFGDKNPKFLDYDSIRENSPVYRARENLRERFDTEPGASFFQSSFIGAIPFFVAGVPAAEYAKHGIDKYMQHAAPIAQYATNSAITLATQMVVGNTAFMANEVRTNKYKYVDENDKLSPKKIIKGFWDFTKGFLSFDIPYIASKLGGQTAFMYSGRDPGVASALFDSIALPLWYTLCIPIGLNKGLIKTKSLRYKNKS